MSDIPTPPNGERPPPAQAQGLSTAASLVAGSLLVYVVSVVLLFALDGRGQLLYLPVALLATALMIGGCVYGALGRRD